MRDWLLHVNYYHGQNFVEGRRGFYGPTVEFVNDSLTFLPDTPKELVMAGKMTKVPWIVGVNANEGLLFGIRKILAFGTRLVGNSNYFNFYVSDAAK